MLSHVLVLYSAMLSNGILSNEFKSGQEFFFNKNINDGYVVSTESEVTTFGKFSGKLIH